MQTAVANYGYLLQDGTGENQTGNVLMDNQTGAVIGFVGGLNYNTNQNNHAFDLRMGGLPIQSASRKISAPFCLT